MGGTKMLSGILVLFMLALLPYPGRAASGDGASSNIRMQDTNFNGKIDRIMIAISNPSKETWRKVGTTGTYGFSVKQNGKGINIKSINILNPSENPAQIQIDLMETDSDLVVDTKATSTNPIEVVYGQKPMGPSGCTGCIYDGVDDQLNTIANGDASPVNTEIDAAGPVLLSVTPSHGSLVEGNETLVFTFSERITKSSLSFIDNQDVVYRETASPHLDKVFMAHEGLWVETVTIEVKDIRDAVNNKMAGSLVPNPMTLQAPAAPVVEEPVEELVQEPVQQPVEPPVQEPVQEAPASPGSGDTPTNTEETVSVDGGTQNEEAPATPETPAVESIQDQPTTTEQSPSQEQAVQTVPPVQEQPLQNQSENVANNPVVDDGSEGGETQEQNNVTEDLAGGESEEQNNQEEGQENNEVPVEEIQTVVNKVPRQDHTPGEGSYGGGAVIFSFQESAEAVFGQSQDGENIVEGDLIQVADHPAIYRVNKDGQRQVFLNQSTYESWYGDDFSQVKVVSQETIAAIPLRGVVFYNAGTLVKMFGDARVYLVGDNGGLSRIENKAVVNQMI